MRLTLEREFEKYKAAHKYIILKSRIMTYYLDLEKEQVNIPDFLRNDTPEQKADREIRNLLCMNDNGKKFNELYEKAWADIAEVLP